MTGLEQFVEKPTPSTVAPPGTVSVAPVVAPPGNPTVADGASVGTRLAHYAPATLGDLHVRARWLLPLLAVLFVVLAGAAATGHLAWDLPVSRWVARHRTPAWNDFWGTLTQFGGYDFVAVVVVVLAVAAWFRSRALSVAIVVLAVVSPILVEVLKRIVARPRPPIELALNQDQPGGFSFPSGHPLAVAASWAFLPLVVGLYTKRRWIFWTTVALVWTLVVLIAASRVYLGAHHVTDVVASLVLAVLFVAGSEVVIDAVHDRHDRRRSPVTGADGPTGAGPHPR